MSHVAQRRFCKKVRKLFPSLFKNQCVIDVGSLDINGSNRQFFRDCFYLGIDLGKGKGVDLIGAAHETIPTARALAQEHVHGKFKFADWGEPINVMISTECLEHDRHWKQTISVMYNNLNHGGLMIITCAAPGREEHGTHAHDKRSRLIQMIIIKTLRHTNSLK